MKRAPLFADLANTFALGFSIFVLVVFFTLIALGGGCARTKLEPPRPASGGCDFEVIEVRTVKVDL